MVSRAVARALHGNPRAYQLSRRVWANAVEALPARRLDGIPGRVHPADLMLESRRDSVAIARYAEAGQIAVELLEGAVDDLALSSPLDLGCGHGRVARWLVLRVEPRRITVTDVDPSAVRFCRSEFGVDGFVCSTDPASLLVTRGHDVVWMGSVITHLDRAKAGALLHAVSEIVTDGAALVVTQHSPSMLGHFARTMPWVGRRLRELEASLADDGWAYVDYPHHGTGYGLAFATDDAMQGLAAGAGMTAGLVRRRAWLEHDAWVLRRVGVAGG